MAADLVGRKLAQFQVLELLGEGGMGVVYKAHDDKLDRDVALKVLRVDGQRVRRRLMQEARSAAAVSHGSIATVYDVGEADGLVFIAMEYVDGESLRTAVNAGPLPLGRALRIGAAIARALQQAHAAGVIHRDLKPDNVLLTHGDGVKVLDFGLARRRKDDDDTVAIEQADTAITRKGDVMGTPGYMSPEQALGLEVDWPSDVFSLGVLLYEMLTGQRPFGGETLLETAVAVTRDEPQPLSTHAPSLPPALDALLARCLDKDPDARVVSAGGLADELDAIAADHSPSQLAGKPAHASRSSAGGWVLALIAAGLMAAALLWAQRGEQQPVSTAAAESSEAEPTAVAITDLPAPKSSSPDALAAYARALQAFRDSNWDVATRELDQAVKHDEHLAVAHLRLSLALAYGKRVNEARAAYRRAVNLRSQLSDRDLALLSAYEHVVMHTDYRASVAKMRDAVERFPLDAEMWHLLGYFHWRASQPKLALEAARRATALDAGFADAWQLQAIAHMEFGDAKKALKALDACIESSPLSADCLTDRMKLHSTQGRCDRVIADAKNAMTRAPESPPPRRWLANALATSGAPLAAVIDAAGRAARLLANERHEPDAHLQRASLATYQGKFDKAEQHALRAKRSAGESIQAQAESAGFLVDVYLETGQRRKASTIATEFVETVLARDDVPRFSPRLDPTPRFLRLLAEEGVIDANTFDKRRDAWLKSWSKRRPGASLWIQGYLRAANTEAQARDALAQRPSSYIDTQIPRLVYRSAAIGRVELLAGKLDEALVTLERASKECEALRHAVEHAHVIAALGRAHQAKGNDEQACAAFAAVLKRWGQAQPRSITAEDVRKRAAQLRCDLEATTAAP